MKTRVFPLVAFLVTLVLLFGPALAGAMAKGSAAPVPASHYIPDEADGTAAMSPNAFNTFPVSSATRSYADMWHVETVDSEGWAGETNSLALDGLGRPHISYSGAGLRYTWHDGTTWHIETVDSAGGWHPSLALDGAGQPHISYQDATNNDLKYTWHDGGTGWHVETVDSEGWVGGYSSLALDGASRPHMSYCDQTNSALKYAWRDGTTWHVETVDSGTGICDIGICDTTLALDGLGRPHISYSGAGRSYAWHDGTTWHIETLRFGLEPSLALDGAGRPHISYQDHTNHDLKYAWHDGTVWHTETVDSAGWVGGYSSLALDGSGRPHISYYDAYPNRDLKHAWHDGAGWHVETADSSGNVGLCTSLALDRSGQSHISYFDYTNRDLKYARRLPFLVLDKQATPTDSLRNSDTLTYTLTFSSGASLSVRLWDPLPANVHYVSNSIASNVTPPAVYSPTAEAIVWQGTMTTDTVHMVRFQVTPGITGTGALSLSAPIVNTAWLTDTENDRSASVTVIVNGWHFYLPLMLREEYP